MLLCCPDWLTLKVLPAMVMLPLLALPLLAEAVKLTAPLPVPLLPEIIVTQSGYPVAVQVQELSAAVTVMLPLPPDIAKLWLEGDIVIQPVCVIVKVLPEMVIVPLLVLPLLAATVKSTFPLPVVIVTQSRLSVAVH